MEFFVLGKTQIPEAMPSLYRCSVVQRCLWQEVKTFLDFLGISFGTCEELKTRFQVESL